MAWFDALAGIGGKTFDWLGTGSNMLNLGKMVGGIGQGWAALNQADYAKKMLNLQQNAINSEEQRRKKAQLDLDKAVGNVWGTSELPQAKLPL